MGRTIYWCRISQPSAVIFGVTCWSIFRMSHGEATKLLDHSPWLSWFHRVSPCFTLKIATMSRGYPHVCFLRSVSGSLRTRKMRKEHRTRTGENRESPHHIPNKYLVGGFKHGFFFHFINMGCHPFHWRTPSFFKMVIAPPTRYGSGEWDDRIKYRKRMGRIHGKSPV